MTSSSKTLSGQVCIVTGANTGIGKVTATDLAAQGAHVFVACRNAQKGQATAGQITEETGSKTEFLQLDLADLASVRCAAETFLSRKLPLHILVNNAGLAGSRGQTQDGFEIAFGVNHLGPFLFTSLLLDTLKSTAPARVVNVSSKAHYAAKAIPFDSLQSTTASFTGMPEYRVSKLANVLFTAELARRLKDTQVTTYALHPGVVASDIWHRVPGPFRGLVKHFMITVEEGAKTSIHCARTPELGGESGLYYDSCQAKTPSRLAQDHALAGELWDRSVAWSTQEL